MNDIELLDELTSTPGVSGDEKRVADIITENIKGLCDEYHTTALGSVIALKKSTSGKSRGKIAISAHMDEIGFVVSKIEEGGYLRLATVGGVDPKILSSQEVIILSHTGKEYKGVIGALAPHLQTEEERKEQPSHDKVFVDVIGLGEDEVRRNIRVGDSVTMTTHVTKLLKKRITGKSLDDRICVLTSIKLLRELNRMIFDWDIYIVFSSQEEIGSPGARVATYEIEPDIGIAIDVTMGDIHGVKEKLSELGKGPVLSLGPTCSPKIAREIKRIAREINVPLQLEASVRTGTDADSMFLVGSGVPIGVLSIPLRYMHTNVELIDLDDVNNLVRLLSEYINRLDKTYEEAFL